MFRGFLSGVFWGSMVGALVLAVLSLYAPLPMSQADAGVGVQAPNPDSSALATDNKNSSEETGPSVGEGRNNSTTAPKSNSVDRDTPSTQTPEVPEFQSINNTGAVTLPQITVEPVETPDSPEAIAVSENTSSDRSLLIRDKTMDSLPVAVLKTAPDELGFDDEVLVRSAPSRAESEDQSPQTTTVALADPMIGELAPAAVEDPTTTRTSSSRGSLPQITAPDEGNAKGISAKTPIGVQVDAIENPVRSNASNVVVGRLPTVTPDVTQAEQTAKETQAKVSPTEAGSSSRGALFDHAEPFTSNAQALFSIVIIDAGKNGVPREQLLNSSYPITVAIDPSTPDAASLMSQYRAAGVEVVALVKDLPTDANASDIEVAMSGYFDVVDRAVAVLGPLDKRLQNDRSLLTPVLGAISDTGHGFVSYSQGLNTTQQEARRSGVPSATIFRILDAEGESSAKIKRYLKRAAFNAGRDGSVVVVGRSLPDTMTAILEWALENNDAWLSLAPISAILKVDANQKS